MNQTVYVSGTQPLNTSSNMLTFILKLHSFIATNLTVFIIKTQQLTSSDFRELSYTSASELEELRFRLKTT